MEFCIDDEYIGKCRKHPWQPRHGVCAVCLKDRLTMLCPDCARLRPCACCSFPDLAAAASSASSSSSFDAAAAAAGSGAPMSFLIENEPPLRRSKSVAFSFLRPKPGETPAFAPRPSAPEKPTKSTSSFWSFLKSDRPKKKTSDLGGEEEDEEEEEEDDSPSKKKKTTKTKTKTKTKKKTDNFPRSKSVKYPRSKSVGASCYSDIGESTGGLKGWGWYFPSPMKVFLHPKSGKVARERSPLCRG